MDITSTLAPTSDQLDAIDLVGGPQTFTVDKVSKGNAEQPVNVHLAEFPRVWRPGKSMRRVLAAAWGPDASAWTGRRVELYCDPSVMFGGEAVGGTRISRLSHIDGPLKVPLLVKRGKSAIFTVTPLPDQQPAPRQRQATPLDLLTQALTAAGIGQDQWLARCSEIVGRPVPSPQDLTADECSSIIDALRAHPETAAVERRPAEAGDQA